MNYLEESYHLYLKQIFDRWTRETERSIWAGHYESEKDRINMCFDIAHNKAREVYAITTPVKETVIPIEDVSPPAENFKVVPCEMPTMNVAEFGMPRMYDPKLPLVNLSLSPHLHNLLHVSNLKTLDQLMTLNQTQIESILCYSEKNLLELIIELDHLGIKHNFSLSKAILREILPNATAEKPKPFPESKFIPDPFEEEEDETDTETDTDEDEFIGTMISEFEFTPRVHSRLKQAGINTLDELLSKTTQDLLNIKQFGYSHLKVIIDELDQYEDITHSFKMP